MKKGILLCILLMLSGAGYTADQVYTGPVCPKDEIVMNAYNELKAGLPEIDYKKKLSKKDQELYERIQGYMNEFNIDNKKLNFTVVRLAAERMSRKEIKEVFEDDNLIDDEIYKEYYKIKNNNGSIAIFQTFNEVSKDDLFRCSSIGSVSIVSYDG